MTEAIQAAVQTTRQAWVTALLGMIAGLLLAPLAVMFGGSLMAEWDARHPVATGEAVVVSHESGTLDYDLLVNKLRACEFQRITTYSIDKQGVRAILPVQRLDSAEEGVTYPVGTILAGRWRTWPPAQAVGIEVIVTYSCDGRTNLASVGQIDLRTLP